MSMAALLRSVATKMARAPPRLPIPTSSASRFSTSTGGSMPPSANLRGPQAPSGSHWYRAIAAFNEAAPIATFFLLGGIAFMHFSVNPALDRMEAGMDDEYQSWVAMREEIKKIRERRILSNKESHIGATDDSEG